MKAAFHYVVKAKLIRFIINGEIDFIELNESFANPSPIIAREEAFNFYQNYIDVLLQQKGGKYHNDKEARKTLTSFIDPGTISKVKFGEREFEISDSIGNGIGIYLVVDRPIQFDIIGDEWLIHGIGDIANCYPQGFMDGLYQEHDYYEHYGYDTKNYKQTVLFYDYKDEKAELNEILKTPFDWTGYDVPFYGLAIHDEDKVASEQKAISYQKLIDGGETNKVEFKPSLLYYYSKDIEKSGYRKSVRHIIAKVLCSFLNSNGGYLFIGVQDNKQPSGLADDFSLARPKGKDPKDFFSLEVDKLLREYFKSFTSNISGEFTTIDGIEIYVLKVDPSNHRPVFIMGQFEKEFYVRLMSSCERFKDIEEIATYCIEKWGYYKQI